jgi:hypothetical protein
MFSQYAKTATAVHQNEWQRKLFTRRSGSESCSSERVAAKAVHQNEWQQGLFNESTAAAAGSKGCLLRRHQRQLSESSTGLLWRPIRQEDV